MIRSNTGSEPIAFVLGDMFGSRKVWNSFQTWFTALLKFTVWSLFSFHFPQDADLSNPAARDGALEQPALDPRIEKTTFP